MKKILGVLLIVLVALSSWELPLWLAPTATPTPPLSAGAVALPGRFVAAGVSAPPAEKATGRSIQTARAGRVWEVYFTVGQRVRKGQVLVKLAHSLQTVEQQHLQAQIKQQQALCLQLAATASADVAAARTKLQELQQKLANTSPALAFEYVTAPEDGFVTGRSVTPGDYVALAQSVASFVTGMPADTTLLLSSVE
ncbi:biotin/lipoyl-binding protein [Hymenobacter taeanensis]|uniref:Biotin/lipoyl-binding protein n=1 Tax=Hymenobacter taeanensis TaxID=2735321 RepID=A0A6M6BFD0_9BACT|nr:MULTISPECIES: efflux RND transporter periplasmic adaptor subunit [Hymenobacter]QJX46669.1 biotin/lipoyl-binding protein [Hymenobacter taeanensis]UOQ80532.1 efflux RND transporter periplasmic adaptor subunit [Hymenobacter sp. 5414T-23]